MKLMGYTDMRDDGVAFPEGAEVDQGRVLNLIVDIFQARKELEIFLEKKHPYPEKINAYISQHRFDLFLFFFTFSCILKYRKFDISDVSVLLHVHL